MTVKDLYEWAKENNVDESDIKIHYDGDFVDINKSDLELCETFDTDDGVFIGITGIQ